MEGVQLPVRGLLDSRSNDRYGSFFHFLADARTLVIICGSYLAMPFSPFVSIAYFLFSSFFSFRSGFGYLQLVFV